MTPMEIMLPALAVGALAAIDTISQNQKTMNESRVLVKNNYMDTLQQNIQPDNGMHNSVPSAGKGPEGRGR